MFDAIKQIAEPIWKELESGADVSGWQLPWHRTGFNIPKNAKSGRHYRGGNIFWLTLCQMNRNYPTNFWATYKNWQEIGGQVQKGEKSTLVVLFKRKTVTDKDDPEKTKSFWITRHFFVFNAAQQLGWNPPTLPEMTEPERDARAETLLEKIGAKVIFGGDRACYVPSQDSIMLPERKQFRSKEDFYSTNFHEHCHWTGHESRLNRDLKNRFGDDAYAFEELVADMGGAMLSAYLGITSEIRKDHVQYVGTWARRMKADAQAFFTAASKAQLAMDYLLKKGGEIPDTEETEE